RAEYRELRSCLLERRSRPKTADHADEVLIGREVVAIRGSRNDRRWDPECRATRESRETARCDADDAQSYSIHADRPPDPGRIAAVATLPEIVAEDRDGMLARPVVLVEREPSAGIRLDAKQRPVVGRHDL